jgi:CheY-like chemotaxis protein
LGGLNALSKGRNSLSPEVAVELIRLVPSILWILFIIVIVAIFHRPIRQELLPRMTGLKAFGFEATFIREELDKAVDKQAAQVSENDRSQVLRRASRVASILQEAQILWVDDNPDNNIYERRMLRSLGIFIDLARSTQEALSMLQHTEYDVVISDMEREGVPDEGIRFLNEMRSRGLYRWTIFYVASYEESRGVPPFAFGMTNRPDHLLHYIMDILERERS